MKNFRISLIVFAFLWFVPILTASALSVKTIPDCRISGGAKICTDCFPIFDNQPFIGQGQEVIDKKSFSSRYVRKWKQCESCSETYEPFVEHKNCKTSNDCALVKADCCSGPCRPLAIHKAQVGKYNARLKEECYGHYQPPKPVPLPIGVTPKPSNCPDRGNPECMGGTTGGTVGVGEEIGMSPSPSFQCVCGQSSDYTPQYAAVCRPYYYKREKGKTKDSSNFNWKANKKHKQKYCAVLEYLPKPK
ncbi:MAG: hypothetical protein OXH36_04760, partial [Bdellovibrionales bacterium]|nr:hypothetical protein [Bdellovibrionales bacterium]